MLLKAVRGLPEQDQDAVLALLLQGLANSDVWTDAVLRRDERRRVIFAARGSTEMKPGGRTPLERTAGKVVPIRFPTQQYEELKAWCEEHSFPMAAVVRGLVERFLESQELP